MRQTWNAVLSLLLSAALLLTAGCESRSEPQPAKQQVLRYVNYSPIGDVDPYNLTSSAQYTVACHVLEGLMRVYQYELCYGMAEGYEISEDGCTYRFFLREDACYSDGTPVQAADFQRTMRRLAEECYLPSQLGLIENAREVYKGKLPPEELAVWTEGQRTLCIQLEHPAAQFLQILALPTYAPTRSDRGATLRPEDCNGPFVLEGPETDGVLSMEKNGYYWNAAKIHLDRVEAVTMSGTTEAYEAFERGEVQVVPLPLEGEDTHSGGVVRQVQTGIMEYIKLWCQGEENPLRSQNLRLALNNGLDRTAYVQTLSSTVIQPWARCVLPEIPGMRETYVEEFPNTPFSLTGELEKARGQLDQALQELNLADASELKLTLVVHNDSWSIREGQALVDQWQEHLGVTVKLECVEDIASFTAEAGRGVMVLEGSIGEYNDPVVYLEGWTEWEGLPFGVKTALRQLLVQAAVQTDRSIRLNCLHQTEELLLEQGVLIPLQIREDRLLIDPHLRGFETSVILAGGGYEFLYGCFY